MQIQKYYKCIVATQPRASIAIFYYDKDDKIKFWGMRKEEKVEPTIGYPHTGPGDSGSPIWTHVTYPGEDLAEDSDPNLDEKGRNENSYQKNTLIAVNSRGYSYKVLWNHRKDYNQVIKCSQQATKLTNDIILWIRNMDKTH